MPINETVAGGMYFQQVFVPSLLERIQEIVNAPISNPEMLWISLPLIATLILMEFYIGRYRDEELGWNTAVGNSMVLMFVGIDLLRKIYGETFFYTFSIEKVLSLALTPQTLIALLILAQGMIMILINFFHLLPKTFAFKISSPLFVNLIAYLAIVLIYTKTPIDGMTAIASFLIFAALILMVDVLHIFIPRHHSQKSNVEKIVNTVIKKA